MTSRVGWLIHRLPPAPTCWVSRLIRDLMKGSYRGSRAAAVWASTAAIQAVTRAMTARCWLQHRLPFIGPLRSCSHIDGEIQGCTNNTDTPPPPLRYTDALVYDFIPERLYALKQTQKKVIVRKQLSGTVHLRGCWRTTGPLLMRLEACEWEVRHPWPFS